LVNRREQFFNTNSSEYFTDWGKFGVTFISNLCNAIAEKVLLGLKILVPGVQVPVLAYIKTSLPAGFSSLEPSLEFCPVGVELPINRVYWGRFGVNTGVKLESEISKFALMAKASAGTPQVKTSVGSRLWLGGEVKYYSHQSFSMV
jgi:hypothetical protein